MEIRKLWNVKRIDDTDALVMSQINEISMALGISTVASRLLYLRGYTDEKKAKDFVEKNGLSIYDPFKLPDMDKAVERIMRAIENGEKIAIYGDYDVDGVSAISVIYLYLEEFAEKCELGYYIPDRFAEGYGMSSSAIETIASKGVSLIITVDTGITAVNEINYARELGIDVVVSDHHECPEVLPDAVAVINPHRNDSEYPFSELAGVGVAFKLVTALEMARVGDRNTAIKNVYSRYADLVTLGTIADVMPVVDENRNIIYFGLDKIKRDPRSGIKALLLKAGVSHEKCTTANISFGVAPRINAAGRMEHASRALELLLLNNDEDADKADLIAEKLSECNKERQQEEQRILEEAYEMVEKSHDFNNDRIIVLSGDSWHQGVIGIVASKIVEKYGLPTIMITFDNEDNNGGEFDIGKGSGRSVSGVNLVECLNSAEEYLIKFGGHELAAGLSVTRGNLEGFKKAVNDHIRKIENEDMWITTVDADLEITPVDVNMKVAEDINLFEPFGMENPTPVFFMSDVNIVKSYPIGGGKHIKFVLEKDGVIMNAIMFGAGYGEFNYNAGESLDVMFNLNINEYNGYRSVQLILRETRYSEAYLGRVEDDRARYSRILSGESFRDGDRIIPSREDFSAIYKALRFGLGDHHGIVDENRLLLVSGAFMGRVKLWLILDVLDEMGICKISRQKNGLLEYSVNINAGKVNLEDSPLLKKVQSQLL